MHYALRNPPSPNAIQQFYWKCRPSKKYAIFFVHEKLKDRNLDFSQGKVNSQSQVYFGLM